MSTMGDLDPLETTEWMDALGAVKQHRGPERAGDLFVNAEVNLTHLGPRTPK